MEKESGEKMFKESRKKWIHLVSCRKKNPVLERCVEEVGGEAENTEGEIRKKLKYRQGENA